MDAFVQLALIEKAKRVFAPDPSTMLSFPLLAPLTYTEAELAKVMAPATAADYAVAADFARAVNFLPRDMVASASERMLWDIYHDVLYRGTAGQSDAAVAVDASATALLYDIAPDGTRVEGAAMTLYRQCRDAWIVAREDYAAHKLTGEMSEDPDVRQNWTSVEEPALRMAIDAASQDWDNIGQRSAVEAALQAETAAGFNDPQRRWAEWRAAFNPDIDMITDAFGGQYAPTGFSPGNFVEHDDWLDFTLSAAEMRTLVAEAPAALKLVLDDDLGDGIDHVSFQYRSVALIRAWFRPEVYTSRIWRSADPDLMLCDAADPPNGVCPAYPTACIFVRNVTVVSMGPDPVAPIQNLHFTLDARRLTLRRDLRIIPSFRSRIVLPDEARIIAEPALNLSAMVPQQRAFQRLDRASFNVRIAPQRIDALSAHALVRSMTEVSDLRTVVSRPPRRLFPPKILPPEPPPEPPPRKELSILAFICKRLPKSPDPAPELIWV